MTVVIKSFCACSIPKTLETYLKYAFYVLSFVLIQYDYFTGVLREKYKYATHAIHILYYCT